MTPEPIRFTIELAGRANSDLEHLATRAERHGLESLLVEVLRQVLESLETQPRDWGDPYVNYRELQAVGYGKTILSAGLRIVYSVHDSRPLVWLSALVPLPDSPFARA